jgi:hypothetical protein
LPAYHLLVRFAFAVSYLLLVSCQNAEVALEEKVPVINYSLGKGEWIAHAAHAYGGKVRGHSSRRFDA